MLPMPVANAPSAPYVTVCESPPTTMLPGATNPCSTINWWQMPLPPRRSCRCLASCTNWRMLRVNRRDGRRARGHDMVKGDHHARRVPDRAVELAECLDSERRGRVVAHHVVHVHDDDFPGVDGAAERGRRGFLRRVFPCDCAPSRVCELHGCQPVGQAVRRQYRRRRVCRGGIGGALRFAIARRKSSSSASVSGASSARRFTAAVTARNAAGVEGDTEGAARAAMAARPVSACPTAIVRWRPKSSGSMLRRCAGPRAPPSYGRPPYA